MKKSILMGLLMITFGFLHTIISIRALAQSSELTKLDVDEDGLVSIREAVADPEILANFGRIDTDRDGKISAKELANRKPVTPMTAKK